MNMTQLFLVFHGVFTTAALLLVVALVGVALEMGCRWLHSFNISKAFVFLLEVFCLAFLLIDLCVVFSFSFANAIEASLIVRPIFVETLTFVHAK